MPTDIEVPFWDGDEVVYGGFRWVVIDIDGVINVIDYTSWATLDTPYSVPRPSVKEVVMEFVRNSK